MDQAVEGRARVDPVITEIVRNGVIAVTEEMKTNLMRTAYNLIIYEALDFTTGLFTATGETVSIGLGLPMFIRGMSATLKAKLAHFGPEGLAPGDILITNDGYITGSHLNHVTISLPIFHKGRLVAFSCCMAHWLSIGGVLSGMTTDIFSEGLQIPILKLQTAGVLNQDLVDIIKMNVHIPERAMGDLRAQLTAVRTGERRFIELCDRYGADQVLAGIAEIMDHSERKARERTRSIPDGTYEAESFMDDDGIEIGKRVPIRVRVTVDGERFVVDLTDLSHQLRGFYNSGPTTGYGCAQVAYKCLSSPTDYPINDGSFRPLEVVLPPGRVVSAVKPAPLKLWMTIPMTIVDTVFKALAPAMPDRVIAGHHADLGVPQLHGFSAKERRLYIVTFGPIGGGWGAKRTEDGVSATVCINDGDTHNSPVEMMETKSPIMVRYHRLAEDSGGAGRFRGGLGAEYAVQARAEMMLNTRIERVNCPPWGLEGGRDGTGNRVELWLGGAHKKDLPNAKVLSCRLSEGDGFSVRGGGGGGFGHPWQRPAETVQNDVRQGYVSRERAASDYGVVLDPETLEIDEAETASRRAALRDAAETPDRKAQA
jgi:N-methylhydantoinase B